MAVDRDKALAAVRALLEALGYDLRADPELTRTPERVVDAFDRELLGGRHIDLADLIRTGSSLDESGDREGVVVFEDISVTTVCPHHLMPAQGKALVAYVPGTHVIGLGRIAKLVDACARRLTLQERIGKEVVDALMRHGGARGVFCRLSLVHTCVTARNPGQVGSMVHTVAAGGVLAGAEGYACVSLAVGGALAS